MTKPDARDCLVIGGAILFAVGISLIYFPAALISLGAFGIYLGAR